MRSHILLSLSDTHTFSNTLKDTLVSRRGGHGQVVSVLAFLFYNSSSSPTTRVYNFSVKFLLQRTKQTKRGQDCPILKLKHCVSLLPPLTFILSLSHTHNVSILPNLLQYLSFCLSPLHFLICPNSSRFDAWKSN